MAALYADENVPFPVVVALRAVGHDIVTALEDGRANQHIPDPDLQAQAVGLGRAVLTANRRHFVRLHRASPAHAGIVAYTEDLDFLALAARIHTALGGLPDLAGQLIRINRANPAASP